VAGYFELMNNYLRPRLYSVWDLVQEVNCQLLELLHAEVTQSLEELMMKLEPRAEVKSFFSLIFFCVSGSMSSPLLWDVIKSAHKAKILSEVVMMVTSFFTSNILDTSC
jgi:hypothetical protein